MICWFLVYIGKLLHWSQVHLSFYKMSCQNVRRVAGYSWYMPIFFCQISSLASAYFYFHFVSTSHIIWKGILWCKFKNIRIWFWLTFENVLFCITCSIIQYSAIASMEIFEFLYILDDLNFEDLKQSWKVWNGNMTLFLMAWCLSIYLEKWIHTCDILCYNFKCWKLHSNTATH